MPVISRFHGGSVKIYPRNKEHNPPHIHAIYGECMGLFSITTGEMYEGDIPITQQKYIKRFVERNRDSLLDMWETQIFESLPAEE